MGLLCDPRSQSFLLPRHKPGHDLSFSGALDVAAKKTLIMVDQLNYMYHPCIIMAIYIWRVMAKGANAGNATLHNVAQPSWLSNMGRGGRPSVKIYEGQEDYQCHNAHPSSGFGWLPSGVAQARELHEGWVNEVLCRKGFSNRAYLEPRRPKVAHTNMPRRMERKPRKIGANKQPDDLSTWCSIDRPSHILKCKKFNGGPLPTNCSRQPDPSGGPFTTYSKLPATSRGNRQDMMAGGHCAIGCCQAGVFHTDLPTVSSSTGLFQSTHTNQQLEKKTCWNTCPQPILAQHPDDM